jgi:hypothetical protein
MNLVGVWKDAQSRDPSVVSLATKSVRTGLEVRLDPLRAGSCELNVIETIGVTGPEPLQTTRLTVLAARQP